MIKYTGKVTDADKYEVAYEQNLSDEKYYHNGKLRIMR